MARITVTTNKGTVIEIFPEEGMGFDDDITIPRPICHPNAWGYFKDDIAEAVRRARIADEAEQRDA